MKNQKFIYFSLFLIIFLASWLLLPQISLASEYKADGKTVIYDGLVPCGRYLNVNGVSTWVPCQLCHLFIMFKGIIDFLLFKIIPPLAVLMLVIGGAMYIGAVFEFLPGGPKLLGQATQLITSVVIGLVIIFASWLIVNVFFMLIGVASWTTLQTGWFQINCPITIP